MVSEAIIVFARAPIPGETKTRLIPALGPEGAARLHTQMIDRALQEVEGAGVACELWCAPSIDHPFFDARRGNAIALMTQTGNDLGARMHNAIVGALARYERTVLMGTDCPFISRSVLRHALDRLHHPDDVVAGAASDGGYVFIGMRKPLPALFEHVDWGTDRVMEQTRRHAEASGCRLHTLGPFHDIDTPDDLEVLRPEFGDWLCGDD